MGTDHRLASLLLPLIAMLVSDPIWTVRDAPGNKLSVGLFDLLAMANGGQLVDLPNMAAHQRAAVVTTLACLAHVLKRYEPALDPTSSDSWETVWHRLIGVESLQLEAQPGKVAFLQPPTDEPTSQQSVESADLMLPKVEHEVKQSWETSPEGALFALMGSIMRPNVKDHRSSTRIGLSCVLTSSDGSLGSEVVNLTAAYDQLFHGRHSPSGARDHFVWLRPYTRKDAPIPLPDLPKPFLDVGRAQRLRQLPDGYVEIWANPNNTRRIDGGEDPWIDDPHTPLRTDAKAATRYKLAAKTFGYAFEARVLFGGVTKTDLFTRPRILDLTSYRYVRLCALGTHQGVTLGYREALYRATRSRGLFSLEEPSADDRPARLSESLIQTVGEGERSLWSALASIRRTGDKADATAKQIANRGRALFRDRITDKAIGLVFDILSSGHDEPALEQSSLNALVATEIRTAFSLSVPSVVEPLAAARGENLLENAIRRNFPIGEGNAHEQPRERDEGEMVMTEPPQLARQCYAILKDYSQHLSPNDRAGLRTMSLVSPPLQFWKLIARIPEDQAESRQCIAIWKPVMRALGRVRHSGTPLGRVLHRTDFPEDRVSRLLAASGSSLPGLVDEVGRWLVSHDVEHADLSVLATLGLADALGNVEARDWARRRIAVDYVRWSGEASAHTAASKEEPEGEEAA